MFSSTIVLDSPVESQSSDSLPDELTHNITSTSVPASEYSSVHQTALTLVTVASEQAGAQAAIPYREPSTLQEQLAEERTKTAIQRANAEQARRAAECARSACQSLLEHLTQPCLTLDESVRIAHWNATLAHLTGISEQAAVGARLADLFPLEAASQIAAASVALREAAEIEGITQTDPAFVLNGSFVLGEKIEATRMILLPLFRIPGIVENVIVLIHAERR